MAEPGNSRGALESLGLAGIGALALVLERADDLSEELAQRLGVERSEVRGALGDVLDSWRREAQRFGDSTGDAAARVADRDHQPAAKAVVAVLRAFFGLDEHARLDELAFT